MKPLMVVARAEQRTTSGRTKDPCLAPFRTAAHFLWIKWKRRVFTEGGRERGGGGGGGRGIAPLYEHSSEEATSEEKNPKRTFLVSSYPLGSVFELDLDSDGRRQSGTTGQPPRPHPLPTQRTLRHQLAPSPALCQKQGSYPPHPPIQ